jgi:hypothetical protein
MAVGSAEGQTDFIRTVYIVGAEQPSVIMEEQLSRYLGVLRTQCADLFCAANCHHLADKLDQSR